MVAVVQKSSPGVIASHQLKMIQQHPVPDKNPNVVMGCMNRNIICKIAWCGPSSSCGRRKPFLEHGVRLWALYFLENGDQLEVTGEKQ